MLQVHARHHSQIDIACLSRVSSSISLRFFGPLFSSFLTAIGYHQLGLLMIHTHTSMYTLPPKMDIAYER